MVNSFDKQTMRACGREDASPSWISVAGLLIGSGGDRGWWQLSELRFFLRYLAAVSQACGVTVLPDFVFVLHFLYIYYLFSLLTVVIASNMLFCQCELTKLCIY